IGSGSSIAQKLRTTTINNFRLKDVQMGGQGAPLVPVGDKLLFSDYDACLNLGGFANISYERGKKRLAFDICPLNMAFNHLTRSIDLEYDDGGKIAKSGDVDTPLLKRLNSLAFYAASRPKSLGKEWFVSKFNPLIEKARLSVPDKLATCTEHFAAQIAKVINESNQSNVLVTGGGAYNEYLIQSIEEKTTATLIIPDPDIVEFKEAIIFAFLGVLRIRNEVNVLSSVTGSPKDHCAGIIHNP
ncbi:MAG: anhydro-N-acetylmuramic acid kinase, partial [Bacteroidota bacterium]